MAYPHGLESTSSSRRVEQGSAGATVFAAAVAVAVAVTISGPFLQLDL